MNIQLIYSLIAGISIGGVAGYLGSLMLQKRMSLAAGPLSHLAFPGVALAIVYGFDISLGAFPFIILGAVFIWILENKTKVPMDTLTALVFTVGVGASFLFLPIEEAEQALVGNISSIGPLETTLTFLFSLGIFFLIKSKMREMMIIGVSEDLAQIEGISVKKNSLIFIFSLAIIVALGVKLVGALLTIALVSIPAASAKNLSWSLKSFTVFSFLFGILAPLFGISFAKLFAMPAGILTILISAVFFLVTVFFQKNDR